jgi:GntR family transcriptional regulator / MocR family aminotransferase
VAVDESSQPVELLLSVSRDGPATLGTQIEDQLRRAIRGGALRPSARVPSTRDLARQLGVSRRVVVDAYAQLAAEGYLSLRQGARPTVSATAARARPTQAGRPAAQPAPARYDFRPSVPDVALFPRAAWLRSVREALATMTDADLGYGDPRGVLELRAALADHLGRTRGVVAEPEQIVITSGYLQGFALVCRALADRGARRIAMESPSNPEDLTVAARAGLTPVPIRVDGGGMQVDELARAEVEAVALTPAHQNPTGGVLAGERRTALLAWLRERPATAIEDDYDAEYRYDRSAVGALQGLDPVRVVYAGSVSKTLAPALRLGWLVVPPALLDAVCDQKLHADRGSSRIEQRALADFLARGELDRHMRRMRAHYRRRRDALVDALAEALPEAMVSGIAAGLHATVALPDGHDEIAIAEQARRHRIELKTISDFGVEPAGRSPALVLGYAQMPEDAIRAGIRELARAVRAARPG